MSEVTMPRLSDTMEEGELARWLKNVGDTVEKGDVIAEIETDKATMDLEAFESGVLEKQLVEEGAIVPIGKAVAVIGDGSSASEAAPAADEGEGAPPAEEAAREKETAAEPESAEPEPSADEDAEPAPKAEEKTSGEPSMPAASDDLPEVEAEHAEEKVDRPQDDTRLRMSPLARKLAHDNDIDLESLTGSGPEGRIIRADIEDAIRTTGESAVGQEQASAPPSAAATAPAPAPSDDSEVVPLNGIRKVTARRLTESQAVPHFFLTTVADVERLIALRADINQRLSDQGIKVSINDFIVKAVAIALRQHPEANASFNGDSILRHRRVNVGVAVATDAGLLVPVVKDADRKSLSEIGAEVVSLAGRARDGKLTLDQMSGGTFSVSNLGMFGIDEFTAMLNPPEAGILAVGAASPVPVLREGHLVEVSKLKLTLTVDHRAMDGATGAAFLRDLKGILEQPLRILV
ncbi:2-oxo acid dehydrogenase subunit E2 [Microbacterium profundi]|uniref:dihydrolipoamide acetyltransferase family protein n=1 Tax=Microbacterium profundi TaxID=450380 RepID=UPI001F3D0CA3|nr:dihydrolipoamide acetyltransferase family protein [Microbacterium profundi]MCE7483365.1 2-oxo acid dehydrogenase subunit E2 [Microbacterium profundi]